MQRNEPLFASVIDQYWRKFSLLSVSASSGLQEPECRSGLRLESWGISKIEVELIFSRNAGARIDQRHFLNRYEVSLNIIDRYYCGLFVFQSRLQCKL